MTTKEIQNQAKKLKPSQSEISHITTVQPNGLRSKFSIYFDGKKYFVAKGMIFNERQNHEIAKSAKDYNIIVDYLTNQCK